MNPTPLSGVPLPGANRGEWWERLLAPATASSGTGATTVRVAAAGRSREHSARWGLLRSTAAGIALLWLLPAVALSATARAGAGSVLLAQLTLLGGFLIARTHTVSWRFLTLLFAGSSLISALLGLVSLWWGPHLSAAAVPALTLLTLPALMPGRVRRFAVTDWMLWALAVTLAQSATSALLGTEAGQPSTEAAAPMSAAITAAGAGLLFGLGIAGWRAADNGRGWLRVPAAAGAIVAIATVVLGRLPVPQLPAPALPIVVAALLLAGLLADARRMRAAVEPDYDLLPFPFAPGTVADRWALRLTGTGGHGASWWASRALTALVWSVCCLLTQVWRDTAVLLGAHVRAGSATGAGERGRAAAALTRVLRAEALRPLDGQGDGRLQVRWGALAAAAGVLALGLTPALSAGQAEAPAAPVEAVNPGTGLLWVATVLAVLVLTCDGPLVTVSGSGRPRWLLDRGRGPVTFGQLSTPTELLSDLLGRLLVLVLPARPALLGSAAGPRARAAVDTFRKDPAVFISRVRRRGAITVAAPQAQPDEWSSALTRGWVERELAAAGPLVGSDGSTSVTRSSLFLSDDGVACLRVLCPAPALRGPAPALAARLVHPFEDDLRRHATLVRDPRNPIRRLYLSPATDRGPAAPRDQDDLIGRVRTLVGQDVHVRVDNHPAPEGAQRFVVLSPDGAGLPLTAEQFVAAAAERWGEHAFSTGRTGPEISAEVLLSDPGPAQDELTRICLARDSGAVHVHGDALRAAEIAAWVRALVPGGFGYRLWLVDEQYTGHAALVTGLRPEHVQALWTAHPSRPDDLDEDYRSTKWSTPS